MTQKLIKIAFVCTGNSARSQMAEGLARAMSDEHLIVQSAGLSPIGVAEMAVQVMAEIGIDISRQWSKGLDTLDNDLDYVVTLCDHADRRCPVLPARIRLHWSTPDPHAFPPSTDSREGFRQIRDLLKDRIVEFLRQENLLRS